jgi:hypothetical protein
MDVSSQIDSYFTSSSRGWVGLEPIWTFWRRNNLRPFCPQTRHYIAYAIPGPDGPYRLRYFVARFIIVNRNQECSCMLSTNGLATGYIWKSWSEANILAINTQHATLTRCTQGCLQVTVKPTSSFQSNLLNIHHTCRIEITSINISTHKVHTVCSVLFLRYVLRSPTQVHRRTFILQGVSFIAVLSTAALTRCRSRCRFCMRQGAALGAAIKDTVTRGKDRAKVRESLHTA